MFFEHDIWPSSGDYGFSTRTQITLSFDFPSADSEARSDGEPIGNGAWHQVAVSFDDGGDTAAIYCDGVKVKTAPVHSTIGSSAGQSFIGSRGGTERFFKGSLDEIWILSRPQSAAFMKLTYKNQRTDQNVVELK
jgi:hypothetical protein